MKKIVLASHGDLSKGMLHSVNMIIGESESPIETFSLYPGESAIDFANSLQKEIQQNKETQYIIIADVLGGSVHTALMQILDSDNVCLYSGMNMSLVLEVVTTLDFKSENVKKYLETGQSGITYMDKGSIETVEEDEF